MGKVWQTGTLYKAWKFGQNMCQLRGYNSAIMVWIKSPFPLCTCSMQVGTMLQLSNPYIKYCRSFAEAKIVLQRLTDTHMYVQSTAKLYAPPHFMAGHKNILFRQNTMLDETCFSFYGIIMNTHFYTITSQMCPWKLRKSLNLKTGVIQRTKKETIKGNVNLDKLE